MVFHIQCTLRPPRARKAQRPLIMQSGAALQVSYTKSRVVPLLLLVTLANVLCRACPYDLDYYPPPLQLYLARRCCACFSPASTLNLTIKHVPESQIPYRFIRWFWTHLTQHEP